MKLICIGHNYREHILELGNQIPSEPVFFLKPDTAIFQRNHPFFYPNFTQNLHYELELVLRICKVGKCISEKYAHTYYDAIGIGIDFTARDLQFQQQAKGLPWEKAKGFDYSAPLSKEFVPKEAFADINNINFHLEINEKTVQQGNSGDMIFNFDQLIAYVSQFMTLKTGDYIFTGTPKGVGPVAIGDKLDGFLEDKHLLSLRIK